ncbi:MAG: D-glycerate dehydrogenase [Planctomycetes bacterium]|nr:D-glycerate dehydrogenase [Planctomycetota bacterium]
MTFHVLMVNRVAEDQLEPLRGLARITYGPDDGTFTPRDEVLRLAPTLDGIICYAELKVDPELLDAAPRLRIIANAAIGTDNLDGPLMEKYGVWATNTPDTYTDATADCALALILSASRHIAKGDRFIRRGEWVEFRPNRWEGTLLSGKTLGLVGYGAIGRAVRKRAESFGMRVIFHRRSPVADPAYRADLGVLLAESDYVSLHTPLTKETFHMIDARRLAQMKQGAVLVNMARGRVVDEPALVAALESGHLSSAGLDVFENEPSVHPALMKMENVTLTPHVGGATRESRQQARLLSARNVAAALRGERPLTPINNPPNPRR